MDTTSPMGSGELSWADSAACTLPTSERPLRLAEFDDLFATALRSLVPTGSTSVRMELSGDAELAEQTGQLAESESACCSFFTFNVVPLDAGRVALDVQVPASHVDVLNGLVGRANGIPGQGVMTTRVEVAAGLRRGQVAAAADVNIATLRYYERRGLLPEPERSPGGHRLYAPEAVTVLRIIKAAQRLGFTLDEVADLLELGKHRHGNRVDAGLQAHAKAKLAEIEDRIADLETIRENLRTALDAGCDDLTVCANSDCCPLPFVQITTRTNPGRSL